tara:strand:+ start:896 stop:1672 length:777 start_codon:yes stop_codon:yes gene_type:complete
MKKNRLTLTENELVSLIEKISKDMTTDELTEQGRKLKRQIKKTAKLQKRQDEVFFTDISEKLTATEYEYGGIHATIDDVNYKKYPNLKELTEKTLLTQTIEMATIIYTIYTFMEGGDNCEMRKENMKLQNLDDFLNKPLVEVYGDMIDMSKQIPGFPDRDVRNFIKKAEKLINMLHNHDKAISDFEKGGVSGVVELWTKITNTKSGVSELTFDTISDVLSDLTCPPPVDIEGDNPNWWKRTFGGKDKKDKKKSNVFKV